MIEPETGFEIDAEGAIFYGPLCIVIYGHKDWPSHSYWIVPEVVDFDESHVPDGIK